MGQARRGCIAVRLSGKYCFYGKCRDVPLARLTTEDAPVAPLYEDRFYSLTVIVRTPTTADFF